jgi:hypothetical protein
MNHSTKQYYPPPKRAQAMVEFALIIPILLLLLVGLLEFGRLFYAWLIVENSTRFGLRYATAGTFELHHCSDPNYVPQDGSPCTESNKDTEIKGARLPSIWDETDRVIIGFFTRNPKDPVNPDPTVTQADNNYLNITVCAGPEPDASVADPIGLHFIRPQMGSTTRYAECTSGTESAGDPGDLVIVATDYNFTFIVLPIFGIQPEMIHLASYRVGRNETFESAQILNYPTADPNSGGGGFVYNTPTNTPTPSHTPTPTFTPSNTPTRTPTWTPSITSTPTVTRTPTMTRTPTNTPVPSCNLISINRIRFNSNFLDARVRNNNFSPAYLISSQVSWLPSPLAGTRRFDYFQFATRYYDPANTLANSPASYNLPGAPNSEIINGGGTQREHRARFTNTTWQGIWNVSLVFEFPGWGTCVVNASINNFTPTPTLTYTPSRTPTITNTPLPSRTPTITYTPSRTPTVSRTPTPSRTPTASNTPTRTLTPSRTPTRTPTVILPSPTRTPTRTPTRLPTNTPICTDC